MNLTDLTAIAGCDAPKPEVSQVSSGGQGPTASTEASSLQPDNRASHSLLDVVSTDRNLSVPTVKPDAAVSSSSGGGGLSSRGAKVTEQASEKRASASTLAAAASQPLAAPDGAAPRADSKQHAALPSVPSSNKAGPIPAATASSQAQHAGSTAAVKPDATSSSSTAQAVENDVGVGPGASRRKPPRQCSFPQQPSTSGTGTGDPRKVSHSSTGREPGVLNGLASNSSKSVFRYTPSRLSVLMTRTSFETNGQPQSATVRPSIDGKYMGGGGRSLGSLHSAVEQLMLNDPNVYQRVQASLRGITSLAKETTNLHMHRDATGATCINQYVVVKTLGRGSFGKVKLCLNTVDGELYAIKMVNKTYLLRQLQKPRGNLRRKVQRGSSSNNGSLSTTQDSYSQEVTPYDAIIREIAVMKKMDHPNVVKLHEVIDPPGSHYMMMVMEYMEKGPVLETRSQQGFERFPETVAAECFRQVCKGLDYLHYHAVVHGDLKPENLLLSANGTLKIADFGSSRIINDKHSQAKMSCTPAFQAPECLNGNADDPFAADVWALGVCLYCFLFGRLPFLGSCVLDVYKAISTEEIHYPEEVQISRGLRDLFNCMFVKDPKRRISLECIMEHPWVTSNNHIAMLSLSLRSAPPQMIEVTEKEKNAAIDSSGGLAIIRARLKEKTFKTGDYLFKQGEEAHCIFMLMSGTVELVCHIETQPEQSEEGAVDENHLDNSLTIDLDESLTLDLAEAHSLLSGVQQTPDGKVHLDKAKAKDLRRRRVNMALGQTTEYIAGVKGPGQVIGEVSFEDQVTFHQLSARAKEQVVAVKLTEESFMNGLLAMLNNDPSGGDMWGMSTPTGSGNFESGLESGQVMMDSGLNLYNPSGLSLQAISSHGEPGVDTL